MYFSAGQIAQSLKELENLNPFFGTVFLVFQDLNLPEDDKIPISFIPLLEAFLQKYYRPTTKYDGFYTPFKTSNKQKRWNTYQYANSLHRTTVDSFSDVILHPKASREWGWQKDYVNILMREHLFEPISTFDLAVWLFRTRDWPEHTTKADVTNTFFIQFKIETEERKLFKTPSPNDDILFLNELLWQEKSISMDELLDIIGYPPNAATRAKRRQPTLFENPDYGAKLQSLKLLEIGPAEEFELDFGSRINVITGDNALGKTFLLDCAWWALTSTWASRYPAYPGHTAKNPAITFQIGKEDQRGKNQTAIYDRKSQTWSTVRKRNMLSGLSIFSQADGSFAVWDPAKVESIAQQIDDSEAFLYIDREKV